MIACLVEGKHSGLTKIGVLIRIIRVIVSSETSSLLVEGGWGGGGNWGNNSINNRLSGIMSANFVMCKIAHFCTFVCAILTNFLRDFYVLTKYKETY